MNVWFQSLMVPPNPWIMRMGSPDPNSRYPSVTPLTCAYLTGVELIDTAGTCGTTGHVAVDVTAGTFCGVLVVQPAVYTPAIRTAIRRIIARDCLIFFVMGCIACKAFRFSTGINSLSTFTSNKQFSQEVIQDLNLYLVTGQLPVTGTVIRTGQLPVTGSTGSPDLHCNIG